MRKFIPLIAALVSGIALADKDPSQLAGLRVSDICPIGAQIYDNDSPVSAEEAKTKDIFFKQDELFNIGFMNSSNYSTCSQGAFFSTNYFKTSDGTYLYSWDFIIYSKEGQIKTSSGNKSSKNLTIYDMSGYGMAGNYNLLQDRISKTAEKAFQDFVLDWRKSH